MKFCPNCGKELNENADVCLHCGKVVGKNISMDNRKSRLVAGLLGIFLGIFGIHNFYLGYNGKGTAQLLITLLSFGILSFVTYIWGLIESILILTGQTTDAFGNDLKD